MYLLLPLIMMISVIGVYSANQAVLDLVLLAAFGVIGYFMRRNGFPLAPVVLGLVLGGRLEEALRQSMIMTQGNLHRIIERPIVAAFLVLAVIAMAAPILLRHLRLQGKAVEIEREEA
jgi:putative tricarboxylic transport membrane protein